MVRANVFVCQLSQITLQQVEETPKTMQYTGIHVYGQNPASVRMVEMGYLPSRHWFAGFYPSTVLGSQIYSKTRDNDLLIKIVLVRARCTASMRPIAWQIGPTP